MDQVKFFNSIAKDWDNIIKVDEKKINYLLSKIDIKEDDYILDVGTGTGVLIPFLAKLSPKGSIKAVDISCNMLDIARNKFDDINNIEFTLLNVETDNLDEKLKLQDLQITKEMIEQTIENREFLFSRDLIAIRQIEDITALIKNIDPMKYFSFFLTETGMGLIVENQALSTAESGIVYVIIK